MRRIGISVAMLLAGCQPHPTGFRGAADIAAPNPLSATLARLGISEIHGPMPGLPGVGDRESGAVTLYGRNFPLPPGTWTVVDSRTLVQQKLGPLHGSLILSQVQGGVLRGLVNLDTDARAGGADTKLNPVCTASDVLWSDMRSGADVQHQDCAAITFFRTVLGRQNPAGPLGSALAQLDQMGVQTPNVIVGYMVYESAPGARAHEECMFNPDLDGIPPDTATLRPQSAWATYNYVNDPAKRIFVAKMKVQANALRAALRHILGGAAPNAGGPLTPA